MAQNICNICGANYEYKNGRWICPACGAYKPEELSNEEVTLLYNASQKIRLALFDDAEEQYKDIVSKYPDNPDGYWGLVLAKYGIKYEQDYDGKMIPSCYAASYESVLIDKNYLKAIELADKDNKKYYEEQANKIEKIRKEWIDKASKEEPYDIFISYKDTEKENGTERTKDSYDALELYTMLSKLGYRVFYSRESLKDKTGEKYEPYIFNALNTAHIMIVYGSKPEYIESTWIKNEWMRFYKRIKLGKKQPNALLVINNGFNPAELPSPLSKMQTLDRNRLDFSRELEGYCKRVIKAATTVLPKIERVEVKAKQGKVGKIVKIEAVELNSRTAQKAEIVREEVEKREIGNYTVSKLTANAENELKIAEMQLSTANFDDAGKRFNTFLLKNPKNGRALTGKLLAENKSKDLDEFSSSGVQSFADWKLLEQVLLFSEKSISGKILKSLCDEILRSFNTGDYIRARDVYSQVSAYEDSTVTEMRKSVCDLAKGLIGKNDDTAKYFIDGYLLYEQDEDKFLSQIKSVVKVSIEKSDFNFAKKYSEDWLKYENYDLSANYSALKIKYKVKTLTELFAKTENNNAYSEIDDILHCLNEESAEACFKDICDRVNTLLSAGNSAKQVYAYIDKFFRYIFDGREEKIKQFLTFITNKPSKEFTSVFDLLLSLSDFNTEEYSIYTLRFADTALKNGDFDLADKYYDKVNELHETALSWEGKLKCRLKVKNDIEYSANIQNLTDFKIIVNILSLSENDGKRYEFLSRIIGYVYSALKTSKTDAAKLVAVFENLLSYVPKDFDDKIIEWLFKFARFLKNNDEFDLAEKLYAIIINYDAENHVAYWEMLQAKLNCKDENSVIKQYNLISDFQEFQNALLASANNDSALRHYIDIQNKQKAWIEQDKLNKIKAKKRKKIFKVACIMLAVVIIAIAGVFGGLSYYNSENILKYNSVDGGLSVYAGRFYKADETLIIPQIVDGKTVTEIGANAFENHTEIKKVIIPTTVNAIRESAFSGCVNLESVEFSNVAKTNANTQTSANENNGISLFSAQTFNAVNFATVNNNDSIKLSVIGAKAFKGCEKLRTFELNYGLKTIGEEAFSGTGLKEITIPETVEFVGKAAFENCKDLVNIEVGDRDEIPQDWDVDWNKGQETKVEFSVRVIFDYNGADEIIKSEQYVVYDKTYSFPVPVKEGYMFVGWYRGDVKLTDNNGDSLNAWNYQDGGTVKAEFTANENTVFFNGNGATSGETESLKLHTAESANLNSNGFVRNGYTFKGWATSANGTKVYDDCASYTMGKNSSYVLYAVWQANENTLHFDNNGGSGTIPDRKITTDTTITLYSNSLTRFGYTFKGWATTANGAIEYNDNANYTMGANAEYTLYAVWEIDTYSIEYYLNDGDVSGNPTTYTVEDEFTLINPTRTGYFFEGWDGTDTNGHKTTVTIKKGSIGNRVYYAEWTANVNVLHFNANGGSGTMSDRYIQTDDKKALFANEFVRNGYDFVGWATEPNGTKAYDDQAVYTMGTDSENCLYALWTIKTFNIVYNLNDGTVDYNPTQFTVETETFTLNNPTKDGYTFMGWSGSGITGIVEGNRLLTVTIEKGSTFDRSYTANWEANINDLHFNANGGTGEMSDLQIATDSIIILPANIFTRQGYNFIGWATSANDQVVYEDKTNYTMGANNEYTLYAQWSIITYAIEYTLNGGSATNITQYDVNTATFTLNNPTRRGYEFIGWSGTDIIGQSEAVMIEQGSVGNRSYTANWTPNLNTLHFNANGGSGEMADMKISTDSTATLSANTFTRNGYSFTGWATNANGAKVYNDKASYTMGTDAEDTLYAVWSRDTYNITCNLNGGTLLNANPTTYNVDTATFTLNNPTRTGYNFIGWSGTDVTDNSLVVTITQGSVGNRSYSANWSIITYDISYNLDGGTANGNPTNYTVATNTFTLNNPTRLGYNFIGWSGTGISGTSSSVSISKGSIGNRTYTANWQIVEYTVSCSLAGGSVSGNVTKYTVEDTFALNNPTRAGYTFAGWSGTDISGKSMSVSVPKGSVGNRSYAANWTPNQNVIILTDGTSSVQTTGYTDDYARLPANTFEKTNNEFKGWATTQNGEVAYYDRDLYPVGPNSSYTLYAVWEETEVIDRTGWTPISTVAGLNNIRNNLSGKYYLICDLDLYGYNWNPIGATHGASADNTFKGIFDGNGFTIYNLTSNLRNFTIDNYSTYNIKFGCGLFGYSVGTIKNLNIYGANINVELELSSNSGNYSKTTSYYMHGGVVCALYSGLGSIYNCYAQGRINFSCNLSPSTGTSTGTNYFRAAYFGGICGCYGDVDGCSADVTITSNIDSTMGAITPKTAKTRSLTADNLTPWNECHIRYKSENGTYRYQFAKWHSYVNALEPFETKAGYTFIGWSLSDGGAVKYHAGDECFIPLDKTSLTLYPVWQANINDVIFNANGGSGSMANQQIQTDATASLNANTFTKTGYHFIGWATSANGAVVYSDCGSYKMGTNASYTLYAVWEQNTNQIVFDANHGSGTMANQEGLTNSTVTLNQCTFTAPTGYYFAGWSEDPNGSADYLDCASFSIGTNSVYNLYAIWNKMPATSSEYFTFNLIEGDTYEITSVSNSIPSSVIIPEKYNNKAVTRIGNNAFKDCSTIQNVIIYENIVSIGDEAFYNCQNLASVNYGLTSNIQSIGHHAFCLCKSLTEITIPDSVIDLGDETFDSCSNLSSIVIGEGISTITAYMFEDCTNLQEIILGNHVTRIDEQAFRNCSSLNEIIISNSISVIGDNAFVGCTDLQKVYYEGTSAMLYNVLIGEGNNQLIDSLYFYSAEQPITSGKYWHYVNGEPTEWEEILYQKVNEDGIPDANGDYVLFGEYPQSIKADDITISNIIDSRGYYLGSDGQYYAKTVAQPYNYGTPTFSNGETINNGEEYYFKVEPIKWQIKIVDDVPFLISDLCIDGLTFNATGSRYDMRTMYWENSPLRTYLNDEFINNSFTVNQSTLIIESNNPNYKFDDAYQSGVKVFGLDGTEDKVFLLNLNESQYLKIDLHKKVTDYAKAQGAKAYGVNAFWWLRDSFHNYYASSYQSNYNVRYVDHQGNYDEHGEWVTLTLGVVPALKLQSIE